MIKRPERLDAIPLLPLTVAFVAGIATSQWTGNAWGWCSTGIVAVALAIRGHALWASWVAMYVLGSVGATLSRVDDGDARCLRGAPVITGYISDVAENDYTQVITVDVTEPYVASGNAKVKLSVGDFDTYVAEGYEICVRCSLDETGGYRDFPYETDYREREERNGVVARGYITSDSIVWMKESQTLRGRVARWRGECRDLILRSEASGSLKAFLAAVLLGESSYLSATDRTAFAEAGLSHILALSGLHVAIIAMLITWALWPMQRAGAGRWIPIPVIAVLWGYAALTGMSPSVTRSVTMASVYLTGRMIERQASPYNSLCLAALVILVLDPMDLYQAGFQLSFAAVLSILLLAKDLNPVNERKRTAYNAMSYVSVTVSAVLGTFALSALYFHTIPLNFLPANIVNALLFPIILGMSVIALLLNAIGLEGAWVFAVPDRLYSMLRNIVEVIQGAGPSVVKGVYLSAWTLVPVGMAIAALKLWLSRRERLWGLVTMTMILAGVVIQMAMASPVREPRVYVARDGSRTDVVVDACDGKLSAVTTRPQEPQAVQYDLGCRLRDFMGEYGIDSLAVADRRGGEYSGFRYDGRVMRFRDFTLGVVADDRPLEEALDYALICRGARGNIADMIAGGADTVLLSADLRVSVAERLMRECGESGIPVKNLREEGWNRRL